MFASGLSFSFSSMDTTEEKSFEPKLTRTRARVWQQPTDAEVQCFMDSFGKDRLRLYLYNLTILFLCGQES